MKQLNALILLAGLMTLVPYVAHAQIFLGPIFYVTNGMSGIGTANPMVGTTGVGIGTPNLDGRLTVRNDLGRKALTVEQTVPLPAFSQDPLLGMEVKVNALPYARSVYGMNLRVDHVMPEAYINLGSVHTYGIRLKVSSFGKPGVGYGVYSYVEGRESLMGGYFRAVTPYGDLNDTRGNVYGVSASSRLYDGDGYSYGGFFLTENFSVRSRKDAYGIYAVAASIDPQYEYAGYFDGKIRVTQVVQASDKKLKKNVQEVPESLDLIMKLHVASYEFRQDEFPHMHLPEQQTGFLAQELEEVFPELVYDLTHPATDSMMEAQGIPAGEEVAYKGIDYIGLIPFLTKAIQEQQARIEALENQLSATKEDVSKTATLSKGPQNYLFQNTPNPASSLTRIPYFLSEKGGMAFVKLVHIQTGIAVGEYPISQQGHGFVEVDTRLLERGTYAYYLEIHGEIVDTKLMQVK